MPHFEYIRSDLKLDMEIEKYPGTNLLKFGASAPNDAKTLVIEPRYYLPASILEMTWTCPTWYNP